MPHFLRVRSNHLLSPHTSLGASCLTLGRVSGGAPLILWNFFYDTMCWRLVYCVWSRLRAPCPFTDHCALEVVVVCVLLSLASLVIILPLPYPWSVAFRWAILLVLYVGASLVSALFRCGLLGLLDCWLWPIDSCFVADFLNVSTITTSSCVKFFLAGIN